MLKGRLSTLTWRLPNDLASKIFDDCTKEVTENCRVIVILKSFLVKIYLKGSVMVRLEEAKKNCNEKHHWK